MNDWIDTILDAFPWLEQSWNGTPLWIWIVLPSAFIVTWMLSRTIITPLFKLMTMGRGQKYYGIHILHCSMQPLSLLIAVLLLNLFSSLLPLEKGTMSAVAAFNTFIYGITITWMLFIAANILFEQVQQRLQKSQHSSAVAIMPLMRKITKATIFVLAVVFMLQNWGFDVAAIIAALGVGGIAVALASQKSMENLFGGVMVSLDQPIRVGDFGKFGDVYGNVEDIGLRSTKIRTIYRTIVSYPNADMASMRIENLAVRDKMLFLHTIGVRYETTSDQLRYILVAIKEMLLAHPKIDKDPARPRFVGYGDFSLNIEIFAYVPTTDWNEFLEVQEDVLLRIKDIVAEAGSDFAFPSQTVYLERGGGLDEESQGKVVERIAQARQQNNLQWPKVSEGRQKSILNSITYPPEGSAVRNGKV